MSRVFKSRDTQSEKERIIKPKKFFDLSASEQESEAEVESTTLIDIEKQAEQILREAQIKAEKVQNEANEYAQSIKNQVELERQSWVHEREALVEEARKEGYQHGANEAEKEVYAQYEDLLKQAQSIVEHTKAELNKKIDDSDEIILDLSLSIAEKIISLRLHEDKTEFLPLVKQVVKEVREETEVTIYIHPLQYDFVTSYKEELEALFSKKIELYFYPDEDLDDFGCIVESSFGRIDASVNSQLQEIKVKLEELLKEE